MEQSRIIQLVSEEISRRNLSIRDFAKLVGVSHPTISAILNGDQPSFDVCAKLAPVLRIPLDAVLRAADLLPPNPEINDTILSALEIFSRLSPEDQAEFLEFLRIKEQRANASTSNPKTKPLPDTQ